MIAEDYNSIEAVTASIIGLELTRAAIADDGLKHPLEEAESIWNCESESGFPRLQLNSSFNLVTSNWGTATPPYKSHLSTELETPVLRLPHEPRIDDKRSRIFTPLYHKDYKFNQKAKFTYKPRGSESTSSQLKANDCSAAHSSPPSDLVLSPQSIYSPPGSRFFVIKSFTDVDVKSSFMHKVWSSTELGNKRLNKAYHQRTSNERIFLFFSVNGTGKFCGVAEMLSPVTDANNLYSRYESVSPSSPSSCTSSSANASSGDSIWLDKSRWKGSFKVQWICIKDVYNNHFRNFRVPQNEYKPVTNSRDTQELPYDLGCQMLEVFKKVRSNTSFLQNTSQ